MDIARLHMQNQQLDEALTLVDAVTPLDQRVLEQRETLALDLAVIGKTIPAVLSRRGSY